TRPVGSWTQLSEDARGLRVRGRINLDTQAGKETRSLLRSGAIGGLSVGFLVRPGGYEYKDRVHGFTDLELLEVSLTPLPANPAALVTETRALIWPTDLVDNLVREVRQARLEFEKGKDHGRR